MPKRVLGLALVCFLVASTFGAGVVNAQSSQTADLIFDPDSTTSGDEITVKLTPRNNIYFEVPSDLMDANISFARPFTAEWWENTDFEDGGNRVSAEMSSASGLGPSAGNYVVEGPISQGVVVIYLTQTAGGSTGAGTGTAGGDIQIAGGNNVTVAGYTIVVNQAIINQITNTGLTIVQTESGQCSVGGRQFGGSEAVVVFSTSGGDHCTNFSTTQHGTYPGYHPNAIDNHWSQGVTSVTVVLEIGGAYFFSAPITQ